MNEKIKDTRNTRALGMALIPLVLSLGIVASLYYHYYIRSAEPASITISTGVPGSPASTLIEAISQKLAAQSPHIKIRTLATTGTEANIRLLEKGVVDIAAVSAATVTRPNFSLIANLFPDTFHLIVHEDSGIRTVHDLPGKRIAAPPLTSTAYWSFWSLVGQYGVHVEKIMVTPMSDTAIFDALKRRTVDAAFFLGPPANDQARWIGEAARIKLIDIDQADAMALRWQAFEAASIPKGVYGGLPPIPERDIKSVATQRILITRKDFSPEIINSLTRIMFEHRRELAVSSKVAAYITQPATTMGSILPIHAGASTFYNRDQPTFLQENAEVMGVFVSVTIVMVSFLIWLKRRWTEGRKGRIDVYNLELAQLTGKVRVSTTLDELTQHKQALYDMLPAVIRDLDEDNIDGNGFHYFAFTWQAAFSVIREKEDELSKKQI